MKSLKRVLVSLLLSLSVGTGLAAAQDLSAHFRGINGCFVLYDLKNDRYLRYNAERCRRRFSPFSTFKIANSLIGLESGVIKDADFVIPWDKQKYPGEDWTAEPFIHWKRDHNLRTAIKYSVVWYYRELAKRVGEPAMSEYLKRLNYGNADSSGGIDRFWLNSTLQISADEEIEFLKRFYLRQLPFSRRSMDIVSDILILEKRPDYTLSGKTGGGPTPDGKSLGWFVGYLERGGNTYFFATNLEGPNYMAIRDVRINLTRKILADLGYLPKS